MFLALAHPLTHDNHPLHPAVATWGAPLGLLAGWTAYPALTPAYKHEILPSIFPNPDLK